jgi:protein-L-isoaspartate(D-aspartate) O-methyltransferase
LRNVYTDRACGLRRAATLALLCAAGLATAGGGACGGGTGDGGIMHDERATERQRMVERQIAARGIRDALVLQAMASVPRHEFVPAELGRDAYGDFPLPIGEGQTISQPYIVALMTEALRVGPGDRVLELGTGSGYQAAVLATIVDTVFTIEYVPALAERAERTLRRLGYGNVVVKAGDGWGGWPGEAPFAAAIVTFATPEVPPALVDQLVVGGRLCVPIGTPHGVQELMLYVKGEDGRLGGSSLGAVRFVPVQGEGAR